jgi:hypothetical protein
LSNNDQSHLNDTQVSTDSLLNSNDTNTQILNGNVVIPVTTPNTNTANANTMNQSTANSLLTKKNRNDYMNQQDLRLAISSYYLYHYHQDYLGGQRHLMTIGKDVGVVALVAKAFNLSKSHFNTVSNVISQTIDSIKSGINYNGMKREYIRLCQRKIQPGSFSEHFVIKLKALGCSLTVATKLYNVLVRKPQGLQGISKTPIERLIKTSNHVVLKTESISQASDNKLFWKQARFNSCSQLLVRFGEEMPIDTNGATVNNVNQIDKELIKRNDLGLSVHQIGWWDEKHIQQVVGEVKQESYEFSLDSNGLYDPNGKPTDKRKVSEYPIFCLSVLKYFLISNLHTIDKKKIEISKGS